MHAPLPTPDLGDRPLPLFPLQAVLFPDSLLGLKVFEARYLDLIGTCLRGNLPFGVVCLADGSEVRREGDRVAFEAVGVLAHLVDVDAETVGILNVKCRAGQRFQLGPARQLGDGLWVTDNASLIAPDPVVAPGEAFEPCAVALAAAIKALAEQDATPFALPHRLDDAGWVANRWCELLPIPIAARQKLMALDDPLLRLQLVDEFLRKNGVVD